MRKKADAIVRTSAAEPNRNSETVRTGLTHTSRRAGRVPVTPFPSWTILQKPTKRVRSIISTAEKFGVQPICNTLTAGDNHIVADRSCMSRHGGCPLPMSPAAYMQEEGVRRSSQGSERHDGGARFVFDRAVSGLPCARRTMMIQIQLSGTDRDDLRAAAQDLKAKLQTYPGVYGVSDSFRAGKREVKLSMLSSGENTGVTLADLARQVKHMPYPHGIRKRKLHIRICTVMFNLDITGKGG